jgi:hypothetical protein
MGSPRRCQSAERVDSLALGSLELLGFVHATINSRFRVFAGFAADHQVTDAEAEISRLLNKLQGYEVKVDEWRKERRRMRRKKKLHNPNSVRPGTGFASIIISR